MPRFKRNDAEQEIIRAWHAHPEEIRRTSVHAALSAVRVKEKYALGRKDRGHIQAAQQIIIRYQNLFTAPCEPLADLDMRWRNWQGSFGC